MTILIDPPRWAAHDRLWSHLISDSSLAELHAFAARRGIPERGFEGDHYDVPQELYASVVAAGAQEVDGRTLLRSLQRSGLRTQKRRHEKVIASVPDAPWLPPGGRADVVASRQDDAPAPTVVVRLAVVCEGQLLVIDRPGRGPDLPFRAVGEASAPVALAGLVTDIVGAVPPEPRLLGYVRNTVDRPTPDYPWPTPRACFTVYAATVDSVVAQRLSGSWITHAEGASVLTERHWWPLLAPGLP
ncbi:MAG: DUF4031 domain-containing protein [Nostocoides sp.]